MALHTHGLKPDELSFYGKYFGQLVGAEILGFHLAHDEEFGEYWPTFVVRLKSGEEISIEISQDEEGNGPGTVLLTRCMPTTNKGDTMNARDDLQAMLESTDIGRGQWEPLLDALEADRDMWASKAAANLRGWNEATNRAQAWEEALHRWGRHERNCTALDPGGKCSCGLTPFAWPEDSNADYRRDRHDKLAADAREAYIAERESETAA